MIGYEELAIPYIKKCMEAGATQKAYDEAVKLVSLNPSSDLGLRYAINSSGLLGKYDEFENIRHKVSISIRKSHSIKPKGLPYWTVTKIRSFAGILEADTQ